MKTNYLLKISFLLYLTLITLFCFSQNKFPATGNVGIGVTDPAYLLDVNGTGQFAGGAKIGNGSVGFFGDGVNHAVRAFNIAGTSGFWIQSYNGSNTFMYVGQTGTNAGNVGIGTSNPKSKLQLGDFATSANNTNSIVIPGFYNFEQVKIGQSSNGRSALEMVNHTSVNNSYGIKFSVNSDELTGLQIQYAPDVSSYNTLAYTTGIYMGIDGNVGIGTTKPQARLAVNGTVLAKKVRVSVSSSDWPDYVFNRKYKLRSLGDIETYIRKYNHLPEVLSVKEVEEQGLDLAQSQKILLQKIEELTLYAIKQGKQIRELQVRIKKQK